MHLFHHNRTSSHLAMALSLQSNTIVVFSLLSDGKIDLNDENIGVCSRNGHVLGDDLATFPKPKLVRTFSGIFLLQCDIFQQDFTK